MNQSSLFPAAVELPPIRLKLRPRRMPAAGAIVGREIGHQSAEAAAAAAESQHKGWKVAALSAFLKYGREHGGEFATEDVRQASAGTLAAPKNPRCWGHVALAAKKLGAIEWARFDVSKDPKSHCAPSNVWRWIGERS